jgi:hypothetical protein
MSRLAASSTQWNSAWRGEHAIKMLQCAGQAPSANKRFCASAPCSPDCPGTEAVVHWLLTGKLHPISSGQWLWSDDAGDGLRVIAGQPAWEPPAQTGRPAVRR